MFYSYLTSSGFNVSTFFMAGLGLSDDFAVVEGLVISFMLLSIDQEDIVGGRDLDLD